MKLDRWLSWRYTGRTITQPTISSETKVHMMPSVCSKRFPHPLFDSQFYSWIPTIHSALMSPHCYHRFHNSLNTKPFHPQLLSQLWWKVQIPHHPQHFAHNTMSIFLHGCHFWLWLQKHTTHNALHRGKKALYLKVQNVANCITLSLVIWLILYSATENTHYKHNSVPAFTASPALYNSDHITQRIPT